MQPLSWDFGELLRYYRTDLKGYAASTYNSFKNPLRYPYFMVEREVEPVVDRDMAEMWNRDCEVATLLR